ncbi:dihydrolipoyl dehydrogenase [Desulfosporosinus sp. SB140]|uniref:dihydrolipoyl dehydrogenase n=1 Tax=Desulfosporosinus paludis TaxID=3115649 RepID=UPI0038906ED7
MSHYDVAIIGAGPGGYVAAIRAAQLGLKTVVVEKEQVGGTCLNLGCIPTKTLIMNAEILQEIKHAEKRGLKVPKPEVDMQGTQKMKNRVINQLVSGVELLLKGNGIDLIRGEANVSSENTLKVSNQEIHFSQLIIATGSSNFIPPIPGLNEEGILTSTELLELDHVPEKLIIIGGGVIGCELATIFSSFGSKVTIIEMQSYLVPLMDTEVSATLMTSLKSSGVKILTNCKVVGVQRETSNFEVSVTGAKEVVLEADQVLVSVGRKANLKGLEALKLDLERNYIKVNDRMETSLKGVYAVGDITGKIQLAHVASRQGIVAAETIAGKQAMMSYRVVPSCIYTIPEIGSVGLTETQAKEMYKEIAVGKFPMRACGKALAMGATTGFVKIIAEKKSGRVIGCHIIGPNATEIIGQVAAVMEQEGTLMDITRTIHAHPTISETVLEAAHVALGEPIHVIKA